MFSFHCLQAQGVWDPQRNDSRMERAHLWRTRVALQTWIGDASRKIDQSSSRRLTKKASSECFKLLPRALEDHGWKCKGTFTKLSSFLRCLSLKIEPTRSLAPASRYDVAEGFAPTQELCRRLGVAPLPSWALTLVQMSGKDLLTFWPLTNTRDYSFDQVNQLAGTTASAAGAQPP